MPHKGRMNIILLNSQTNGQHLFPSQTTILTLYD